MLTLPEAQTRVMSEDEWSARVELAAAYRAADHFGWTELTANHITLRLPGETPTFLINPYGLLYSEITASSLIKIDINGKEDGTSEFEVNPAGFNIHAAIHEARPDAHCIVHVHTALGMAISALEEGFLPLCLEGCDFHERIGYHSFEGPALEHEERARLVADFGNARGLVLHNHGLITVGETVSEAFLLMYRLLLASQVQLMVLATGRPYIKPSDELLLTSARKHQDFFRQGKRGQRAAFGGLDFAAIMRLMEKMDPSYKS